MATEGDGKQLFDAANTNDMVNLRLLINEWSGNDVINWPNPYIAGGDWCPSVKNVTPLIIASIKGLAEIVRLLLDVPGIDVNKGDSDGWTPLHWASYKEHIEILRLLLDIDVPGIDVNKADKNGNTPLNWAIKNRRTKCVSLLIDIPSIDVNKANNDRWTPLDYARNNGPTECVALLRAKGAK